MKAVSTDINFLAKMQKYVVVMSTGNRLKQARCRPHPDIPCFNSSALPSAQASGFNPEFILKFIPVSVDNIISRFKPVFV